MRVLFTLFALFFSTVAIAQITISGTKNSTTVKTNSGNEEASKEVERKAVEVTKKSVEDKDYVILNEIANSTIEYTDNAVRINVTRSGANSDVRKPNPNEGDMDFEELKKQIIIDLGSPKISVAPKNSDGKPMILLDKKPTSGSSGIYVVPKTAVKPVELKTTKVIETPNTAPVAVEVLPKEGKEPVVPEVEPVVVKVNPLEPISETPVSLVQPEEPVASKPNPPKGLGLKVKTPVNTSPVVDPVSTVVQTPPTSVNPEPIAVQEKKVVPAANEVISTNNAVPIASVAPVSAIDTPQLKPIETPGISINTPSKPETIDPVNPVANNTPNRSDSDEKEDGDFPKKNMKMWGVGINGGLPIVFGDVNSQLGYGGSVTIQKPLGHVMALRFQTIFAHTFGQDWKLQTGEPDFKNYKSRLTDYTLQGVFSLNNINFFKRDPKVIFNVIVGAGFSTRYTWTNLFDENGDAYNYSDVPAVTDRSDRATALDVIKETLDEGFETSQVVNQLEAHIKNTDVNPTVVLGMGLGFKLSKRVDLNIENRISWHNDDRLDGFTAGNGNDWLNYTSMGLQFKIGKAEDAMWWMNPVYTTYDDINQLKKKVNEGELLTDEDQDGVADIFDKDMNTPEKVAVDTRGVASDLDKDGIPDYMDAQPFTPIGASVDENGVAIDTDGDGVADIYDMETNTPANAYVDANGRQLIGGATGVAGSNGTSGGAYNGQDGRYSGNAGSDAFGMVHFELNSKIVRSEFYPELYKVVAFLRDNPNRVVIITGYTDVRDTKEYNMGLSEKRAKEVYRMLTETFMVPGSKLELRYEGEENALIPGLPDPANPKYEAAYYLNRRVTFSIK